MAPDRLLHVPKPRTIGRYYVHFVNYPQGMRVPVVNYSTTTEIEPPFRHGGCVLLKVPFAQSALVVGKWDRETLNESAAYTRALGLRVLQDNGSGWEDDLV